MSTYSRPSATGAQFLGNRTALPGSGIFIVAFANSMRSFENHPAKGHEHYDREGLIGLPRLRNII